MAGNSNPTDSSSDSFSQKSSLSERLLPPWLRATIWSIWGAVSALAIISLFVCTLLWLAGAFGSGIFLASSVQTDSEAAAEAARLTATADSLQLTATADARQLASTADALRRTATADSAHLTATAESVQLTMTANAVQRTATANILQLTATAQALLLQPTPTPLPPTNTPPPQAVINSPPGFVTVRSGPGSGYAPLGTLSNGTVVDVIGRQFSSEGELWWLISFPASPSGQGWVLASDTIAENVGIVAWVTAPPTPTSLPPPPTNTSTSTPIPPVPTPTSTPIPPTSTATATATASPTNTPPLSTFTPTSTLVRPTATRVTGVPIFPGSGSGAGAGAGAPATFTPTATPTPTPTSTPVPPVVTLINPPPSAPSGLPRGILTLLKPLSFDVTHGLTVFEWEWVGDPLAPRFGFEVSVWLEGEPRAGVHDAVRDNGPDGEIEQIGENRYRLSVTDIQYAAGVLSRDGLYQWTVGIVQVNPNYVDYRLEADPVPLFYHQSTSNENSEEDQ